MKIRRGPAVERIINDPPPKPLIKVNQKCKVLDDASCQIEDIFRPLDAKRQTKHGTMIRPEDLTRNVAADIIESFPMVLFRSKKGRHAEEGLKCSRILKKARQEVKLQKELIVEVEMNDSKVAKEMMDALFECTGYQELPQVFIVQTFIGGYKDLKRYNDQGLIEMQLRHYARKMGEPHPAVRFSGPPKKKNPFGFKFVRLAKENADRDTKKQIQKTQYLNLKAQE